MSAPLCSRTEIAEKRDKYRLYFDKMRRYILLQQKLEAIDILGTVSVKDNINALSPLNRLDSTTDRYRI